MVFQIYICETQEDAEARAQKIDKHTAPVTIEITLLQAIALVLGQRLVFMMEYRDETPVLILQAKPGAWIER